MTIFVVNDYGMNNNIDIESLAIAYFEGSSTEEQNKQLMAMLDQSETAMDEFRRLERVWMDSRKMDALEKYDYSKVMTRLENRNKSEVRVKRQINFAWALACASIVGLLLLGSIFIAGNWHQEPEMFAVSSRSGYSSVVTLSDGTKVHLRGNSTLAYSSDYSATNRNLKLVGDGYFDVATDPEHPLNLTLGKCSIVVKGTKFDVSAPEGSDVVKATLIRGHIDFETPVQTVQVVPGQVISYSKSSGEISTAKVDAESYLALMEDHLEYHNVTIAQLAGYLENIYGNKINLDEKIKANQTAYSLRLVNKESFPEVIEALKIIYPMSVRYEGTNVWLTAK